MSAALGFKMPPCAAPLVGWADTILENTGGAPWLWWAVTLVVLVALLVLGLKFLGLFPR